MNQMVMNCEIPFLPEDIVKRILKRLPVKSLFLFQCVCKHWKILIQTPSFITDHLNHSSPQNSLLLEQNSLHFRLLDCGLQVHEVYDAFSGNSFTRDRRSARIVGSCNGLLCVEIQKRGRFPPSLLLWNLAKRACKYVSVRTFAGSDNCVVGFGFSPTINDYKIVRIYESNYVVNRGEVFSLSSRSWKGIDIGNLKGVKVYTERVTADGAIFWSGAILAVVKDEDDSEEGEDTEVIVSFDVEKEVFTLIPRPDLEDYDTMGWLTVHENKLAIFCKIWHENGERSSLIDLWVMKEVKCAFRERWKWTKIYTSNPFSYELNPKTIWRNQIVCKAPSEEKKVQERDILYLLNVTTNEIKRFDFPKSGYIHTIWNYVESLVWYDLAPTAD